MPSTPCSNTIHWCSKTTISTSEGSVGPPLKNVMITKISRFHHIPKLLVQNSQGWKPVITMFLWPWTKEQSGLSGPLAAWLTHSYAVHEAKMICELFVLMLSQYALPSVDLADAPCTHAVTTKTIQTCFCLGLLDVLLGTSCLLYEMNNSLQVWEFQSKLQTGLQSSFRLFLWVSSHYRKSALF
jgi:hypothetical protein